MNLTQMIQKISVREKAVALMFLMIINLIGTLGWTLSVDPRLWPTVSIPTLAGLLLLTLRCGRCGKRVYTNGVRFFNIPRTDWGGFGLPRKCTQCGLDFRPLGR